MFYYIDGYNLIFATESFYLSNPFPLLHQRKSLIQFLQKQFAAIKIRGMLVFDGSHLPGGESGFSYASPLEIVYTPKGQTADEYILEKLQYHQKNGPITVVSNDKMLARSARKFGARILTNEAFIRYLEKKKKASKKTYVLTESPKQMKRLLKIFEEKLKEKLDD